MKTYLFALIFILSFTLACQLSEEERINQTLNRREEALKRRDLSLYLSCIAKDYQDKDENFSRLQSRMDRYFKTFDQIGYSSWDRSIHVEGEAAWVVQQFYLEVKKGKKEKRYSGKEALYLKKEGRGWKIVKGL